MAIDKKSMQPFYKVLIENSRDIVMLLNDKGIIQFLSPSITKFFGYEIEDLVGTLVFDEVHKEDVDRSLNVLLQILEGREMPPFIIRYRHKNGEWRLVEVNAYYLGQDISEVMLTARDVTEYEENTLARRLIHTSFELAFNASSTINSISVVETGELQSVNDVWVKALGWTREEAIGKTSNELNVWGAVENRAQTIAKMKKEGRLHGHRVELRTKTGETCVALLDATYLSMPAGTRLYFSALDITEQEKTEEKLRQSQRLDSIGHLTGGIAHDFNNLLSVIVGHAELAKTHLTADSEVMESLDAIYRASVTGANLIQQLLSFSRKQRLSPTHLQLFDHLEKMRPLLLTTVEKDIDLKITNCGGEWKCLIDPLQLDNAILNMTINARDAMKNGGVVELIVDDTNLSIAEARAHDVIPGDYVRLRIQDTGAGMNDVERKHAFDPFYTTKQDLGGSGLGLSMVFGFISQSGGAVYFESVERGTSIAVLLPRARGADLLEPKTEDNDIPQLQNKKVLVVEDNEDVRDLVVRILKSLGFQVTEAGSSHGAETFEQTRFDLLVCDLMLPGSRKGTEIAARFKVAQPDISVLYMSGYQEGVLSPEDIQSSSMSFIQKPFSKSDFSGHIYKLLKHG